jgi:hypothetical protein
MYYYRLQIKWDYKKIKNNISAWTAQKHISFVEVQVLLGGHRREHNFFVVYGPLHGNSHCTVA